MLKERCVKKKKSVGRNYQRELAEGIIYLRLSSRPAIVSAARGGWWGQAKAGKESTLSEVRPRDMLALFTHPLLGSSIPRARKRYCRSPEVNDALWEGFTGSWYPMYLRQTQHSRDEMFFSKWYLGMSASWYSWSGGKHSIAPQSG